VLKLIKTREVNEILQRKIISALVSGTLFAILLGLLSPNPFGGHIGSIQSYLFSVSSIVPIYMIYSLPLILIYGVITSIISEMVGEFISIKVNEKKIEIIITGVLHIVFGLILLWFSLGASILLFITDRVMRSRKPKYVWLDVIKSLAIPLLTWLLFMGIVWGNDVLFS
jgi:hypothetical protein